jgi:hypothetical protein
VATFLAQRGILRVCKHFMKLTAEAEDFDAELPHRIFLAGGNVVRMFDIVEGEGGGIYRTFDAWELFNEAEFRRVTLHDM